MSMRKSADERVSQALKVSLELVMTHSSIPVRSNSFSSFRNAEWYGSTLLGAESRSHVIVQDTDFSAFGPRSISNAASLVERDAGCGENSRQVRRRTSSSPRYARTTLSFAA